MKAPVYLLCLVYLTICAQSFDSTGKRMWKEFTVEDCFKGHRLKGGFRSDSLVPGHIHTGLRIWRAIRLENEQNAVVFNSGNYCTEVGLFEIIKFGLLKQKLNAFGADDFNKAQVWHLNAAQVKTALTLRDSFEVQVFDMEGNSRVEEHKRHRLLDRLDIIGYLVKEDWIVNSYTGQTEKHVLGLAPLVYDQQHEKTKLLFWLYYPEWRELLACFEAKNFYSYRRISFADVLEQKYFVSMISRESNVFDRPVRSYSHGEEAFLEEERIREKLRHSEEDLFEH